MTKNPNSKNKRYPVTNDATLHPVLQDQLADLRGGMVGAAERQHLPSRFTVREDPDQPRFVITDTHSGRATTVPLCGYLDVRVALADLFPDDGGCL